VAKFISIGIASLLVACVAAAADVRLSLPGGGALVVPVPTGWKESREPGLVPTLSLAPAVGNSFQIVISPLILPNGVLAPADPESLRKLAQSSAEKILPQAVEKSLPIQDLRAANVQGYYFSATDRAPQPGEFQYLTQGAVSIQGLPVAFTIFSNGDPQATVEPVLRMLKAARREQLGELSVRARLVTRDSGLVR
jgi:hypothetical protein